MSVSLPNEEAFVSLLDISDAEQAEHNLEDKQKAVKQEIDFLLRDFSAVGRLQSELFVTEVVTVLTTATSSLLKNKLNFDAAKRKELQGFLGTEDKAWLQKRLAQTLNRVEKEWLLPYLATLCESSGNRGLYSQAKLLLQQQLQAQQVEWPAWVATKTL